MPATSLVDQVRLAIGDVSCGDEEWLSDDTYEWLLQKYSNNVNRASLDAARFILFALTRNVRERAGQIEFYGSEQYRNYKDALVEYLRNPNMSLFIPSPYAGGISKSDIQANIDNTDNNPVTIEKVSTLSDIVCSDTWL